MLLESLNIPLMCILGKSFFILYHICHKRRIPDVIQMHPIQQKISISYQAPNKCNILSLSTYISKTMIVCCHDKIAPGLKFKYKKSCSRKLNMNYIQQESILSDKFCLKSIHWQWICPTLNYNKIQGMILDGLVLNHDIYGHETVKSFFKMCKPS